MKNNQSQDIMTQINTLTKQLIDSINNNLHQDEIIAVLDQRHSCIKALCKMAEHEPVLQQYLIQLRDSDVLLEERLRQEAGKIRQTIKNIDDLVSYSK